MTRHFFCVAFLIGWAAAACSANRDSHAVDRHEVEVSDVTDLLPIDLDFTIRIDSERLQGYPLMRDALSAGTSSGALATDGSGMFRMISPWLKTSHAIVAGGRLLGEGFRGDGVVAVDGPAPDESDLVDGVAKNAPGFSSVPSPGPHLRLYERPAAERDETSLCVVVEGKGIVLATPAEVDSVLRVLRAGPDKERVLPPPRGLLSFAGRVAEGDKLPTAKLGLLREMTRGLRRYGGSVEAGDALKVEAELVYASEGESKRAAEVGRKVLSRIPSLGEGFDTLAASAVLTEVGKALEVRLTVPFALLSLLH